jgi:hypothetical protein
MPEPLRCLDHSDDCSGAVEYRMPLSSTGRAFPRCDHHWERRLDVQQQIVQRYGSPAPPPDFDPLDAGESWNEDDESLDDFAIPGESPDPGWMND